VTLIDAGAPAMKICMTAPFVVLTTNRRDNPAAHDRHDPDHMARNLDEGVW
jgi:hypothetical protein